MLLSIDKPETGVDRSACSLRCNVLVSHDHIDRQPHMQLSCKGTLSSEEYADSRTVFGCSHHLAVLGWLLCSDVAVYVRGAAPSPAV